jgi:uncharacterized membrane protein YgaE (UPF0421/DUF939 family)
VSRIIKILKRLGLTLQTIKTAFAAAASWLAATSLLDAEYPFFAPVAAIITVQVTVADSVDKATQRIIGIIGGVLLSMLLGHWFQVGALSIFFIILIGMAISQALRMNPQIISQVAISSLLVLAFGQTSEGYAYERIIETVLGSVIAVLINALIVPRNAVPEVARNLITFSELAAATLISLTALLEEEETSIKTGRAEVDVLIREAQECRKALDLAKQSLKYNPLLTHKRARLKELNAGTRQLEMITIQIRGIRRSLADLQLNQDLLPNQSYGILLKAAMAATATCIAAFGQMVLDASPHNQQQLAAAIQQALAAQDHCLNHLYTITSLVTLRDMGSILTDLHRIVSETQGQSLGIKNPAAV